jgi:hypothetical protein
MSPLTSSALRFPTVFSRLKSMPNNPLTVIALFGGGANKKYLILHWLACCRRDSLAKEKILVKGKVFFCFFLKNQYFNLVLFCRVNFCAKSLLTLF